MTSSGFLSRVGEMAATGGLTAVPAADLASVLADGWQHEVSPVLLGVLADDTEPRVARLRALSKVLVHLERTATGRIADQYAHAA